MHKIIESKNKRSGFMDMAIGEFCEVVSSQRTLDRKSIVIHTGDIFMRAATDLDWICVSTNHKHANEHSSWEGSVFDFSEDEYNDIEVRIFQPKEIIFHI